MNNVQCYLIHYIHYILNTIHYLQKKKVVVFYGSQTGTSEGFAGRLAKDARRFGMPSMIYDPEDCTDWVSVCDHVCMHACMMYVRTILMPCFVYA